MIDKSPNFLPTDRLHIEHDRENPLRVILNVFKYDSDGKKIRMGTSYHSTTGMWKHLPQVRTISGLLRGPISVDVYNAIKTWPAGTVTWQSDNLKARFEKQVSQQALLVRNARMQTEWRDSLSIEGRTELFTDLDYCETTLPLKEHQRLASFLGSQVEEDSGYALFMEQGTGKTPTMISIICQLTKRFHARLAQTGEEKRPFRSLIVVPPALKLNWKPELDKFSPLKGYHMILEGTPSQRWINLLQAFADSHAKGYDYAAIIVAYDTMVSSKEIIKKVPWDVLVCDESHWFKDPDSKRAKALLELRDKSKFRFPLTGTPFGNCTADLFPQLELIQSGASSVTSYKEFKAEFSEVSSNGQGLDIIVGNKSSGNEHLKRILAERSFICKKEEVLKDLPDRIFESNLVDMVPEQERHYKELATTLVAQLDAELANSDGNVASVNHVLTQLLRLAQITSGYLVIDEVVDPITLEVVKPRQEIFYPKNKRIDHLIELAKELPPDEKMIIWNHWIPMVDKIFERFVEAGLGDEILVYRGQGKYSHPMYKNEQQEDAVNKEYGAFNANPKRRFLLANPASANVGLTLVGYPPSRAAEYKTNCTEMVYFSYDWSYLKRAQANDRFHRIGTRLPCRIRTLMVEGTIDVEINNAVDNKREMADDIMAVREVLRSMSGKKK